MGTAQNIYSLVVKKGIDSDFKRGEEVIKVPCITDHKTKTKLANIDLFTAHFENKEELIEFCKKNDLVDFEGEFYDVVVRYERKVNNKNQLRYPERPVLYAENKVITKFAKREEKKCALIYNNRISEVEKFTNRLLKNYMDSTSLVETLEDNDILYYNIKQSRGSVASLYIRNYPHDFIAAASAPSNSKNYLVNELSEKKEIIIKYLSDNYRMVRDIHLAEVWHKQNHKNDKIKLYEATVELEPLNLLLYGVENTLSNNLNYDQIDERDPYLFGVSEEDKKFFEQETIFINEDNLEPIEEPNVTIDYNDVYQLSLDEFDYEGQSLGHVKRLGTNPSTGKNFNFSQTEE